MFKPTSKLDKKVVFDRFIKELMDYNELVKVLSNNPNFLQKIEKLNERDKQVELYKYAKLLTIKKSPDIGSEPLTYYIKFKWPKEEEGIKILNETLELTLENLEVELFKELDNYFELNRFLVINRDSSRIEYLITQRQIAKKLDIQKNQIDNKSFHLINNAYYLVGYEAIDQEIEFLKKRKYIHNYNVLLKVEIDNTLSNVPGKLDLPNNFNTKK
jgi:LPS O-antigen subunit length determinant protein (WzzB/FepE family)